ncbi:aspartyl/asparaginyl beta-hydroxylase domain-containing protein [Serratia ureilytica]
MHYRGRCATTWRQLSDHSTFTAPLNVFFCFPACRPRRAQAEQFLSWRC